MIHEVLTQDLVNSLAITDTFGGDANFTLPFAQLSTFDTTNIANKLDEYHASKEWIDRTIRAIKLSSPDKKSQHSVYHIEVGRTQSSISYVVVTSIHDGTTVTVGVKLLKCAMEIPQLYIVTHSRGHRRYGIAGPRSHKTHETPRSMNATELNMVVKRLTDHAKQKLLTC